MMAAMSGASAGDPIARPFEASAADRTVLGGVGTQKMRVSGSHIVAFLLVVTLTVLTPEGALSAAAVPGALGARAGQSGADPSSGDIASVDRIDGTLTASTLDSAGTVTVTVTVLPSAPETVIPIYRFYSARSGTHFYTPSPEERDMVLATWPGIWQYEGVAYTVNPAKNTQPLSRFYNRRNGSHFYTASPSERDTVFARWMNIFQYDGETYSVTPGADPSKAPVYRFYNLRNGSHFYTATAEERDIVMARWSNIYQYEGVAFWLGQ